jgi:hypothetical protein
MSYSNVIPPILPDFIQTWCKYGGMSFPNIDTVWTDKLIFPCGLIYHRLADDSYKLLVFFNFRCDYKRYENMLQAGSYVYMHLLCSTRGEYKLFSLADDMWILEKHELDSIYGLPKNECEVIWTNTTIYTDSSRSKAYVAASEPVLLANCPYRAMVFMYVRDTDDWSKVRLCCSTTAFTYDGSYVINNNIAGNYLYSAEYSAWVEDMISGNTQSIKPGLDNAVYQRIWTNHDILDGSGNVWLAANSIAPAEETEPDDETDTDTPTVSDQWIRSFQTGLVLGLAGAPLPITKSTNQLKTLLEDEVKTTAPSFSSISNSSLLQSYLLGKRLAAMRDKTLHKL